MAERAREKKKRQAARAEREGGKLDGLAYYGEMSRVVGVVRAFQLIGFCSLWVKYGCPSIHAIRADLKQAGMSMAAGYRMIEALRDWHGHLAQIGEDPGSIEKVAERVAQGF